MTEDLNRCLPNPCVASDSESLADGPWIVSGYNLYGLPHPRSQHLNRRILIGGVVDEPRAWRAYPWMREHERPAFELETVSNAGLLAAVPRLLAECKAARASVAVRSGEPQEEGESLLETLHLYSYTPGPWIAQGHLIYSALDLRSRHPNGRLLIGGVVEEDYDWRVALDTDSRPPSPEASAILQRWSAATDLLEAYLATLGVDPDSHVQSETVTIGGQSPNLLRTLQKAIDKAEGPPCLKPINGSRPQKRSTDA